MPSSKPTLGVNDLQSQYPDIAAEAYGWDPTTTTAGSKQKKDWKCKEGHIYSSIVVNRTNRGNGCSYCANKQILVGFNDLKTKFPDIADEAYGWDSTTVIAGTHQKKDWKCKEGHIYSSSVGSRTNGGNGCPVCSGLQILAGFNDLKTKFPDIAAEAYGWDPSTVTKGSDKKQDWKCNLGHIWDATPRIRTVQGSGCPYCAGRQVLVGFNDLKTKFPDIAAEAYGWDPSTVVAGTNQKMEWKCKEGHIYSSIVNGRTGRGYGCPFCSNILVLAGFNDLKTKFPDIASEAFGWDPSSVIAGTHEKRDWQCKKGHLYNSSVAPRTQIGSGCPYCANKQILVGFNDLKTKFPDIAVEAYSWDPTTVIAGTHQKKDWKCKEGHIYSSSVGGRTSGGSGCPVCSGLQVLAGYNDLKTKFPDIAAEAHSWDPSTVVAGTMQKKDWKCDLGHIYHSTVVDRTSKGSGCPYCANKKVLAGFNDLKTKFPDIAVEAHSWDPSTIVAGTMQKKDWKCHLGHIYNSTVSHRVHSNSGCPYCANKEVWVGFNDLKTKFPDIADEAYDWDPTTVIAGTHQKKDWKCKEGHIYRSQVFSRTNGGTGCPICSGLQILAGFNDLKTKFPDIAAEAYGWDPSTVVAGTKQKKDWKCKEGHIYSSTVNSRTNNSRTNGGSGCPICAEHGFNPDKDAWFYLMQRPAEQQFGITNDLKTRMRAHERNGWTLMEHTSIPSKGQKVLDTENAFKKWLKKEIGLMEGTTENWSTTKMEVQSLAELKARSGIETDLF